MSLLDYFRSSHRNTAKIAKERLQIVIAHERAHRRSGLTYLPALQQELLEVVRKYIQVDDEQVKLQVEKEGDYEILEVNITLPE